jgi:hypothetical protein
MGRRGKLREVRPKQQVITVPRGDRIARGIGVHRLRDTFSVGY